MPPGRRLNPEQEARAHIDEYAGRRPAGLVVDYADADFAAGVGVAVREFMTPNGPMDYLLVADRKVVGSVEAKTRRLRRCATWRRRLSATPMASRRCLPDARCHATRDRLPFHYISTGTETLFSSRRDPIPRPREVFSFHKPETLAAQATESRRHIARACGEHAEPEPAGAA